jgi:hypothetical protein
MADVNEVNATTGTAAEAKPARAKRVIKPAEPLPLALATAVAPLAAMMGKTPSGALSGKFMNVKAFAEARGQDLNTEAGKKWWKETGKHELDAARKAFYTSTRDFASRTVANQEMDVVKYKPAANGHVTIEMAPKRPVDDARTLRDENAKLREEMKAALAELAAYRKASEKASEIAAKAEEKK